MWIGSFVTGDDAGIRDEQGGCDCSKGAPVQVLLFLTQGLPPCTGSRRGLCRGRRHIEQPRKFILHHAEAGDKRGKVVFCDLKTCCFIGFCIHTHHHSCSPSCHTLPARIRWMPCVPLMPRYGHPSVPDCRVRVRSSFRIQSSFSFSIQGASSKSAFCAAGALSPHSNVPLRPRR